MSYINDLGKKAKEAKYFLGALSENEKNQALNKMAEALINNIDNILEENKKDVDALIKKGAKDTLVDRMLLTRERIMDMAKGINAVAALKDPIGEVMEINKRPNGLIIEKVRVPIGVIGIIYENRPNVTSDAAALCFKTGNAVILRGGSGSINSNKAIVYALNSALGAIGYDSGCIQLVENTSRAIAKDLMTCNEYLDLLIPRGGESLIQTVVKTATVPVIETGIGNCHVYVDNEADLEMAKAIVYNAKTSRPGVCNSLEKLLVHEDIYEEFLPKVYEVLKDKDVVLKGCEKTLEVLSDAILIEEEEYKKEFLDYILGVKVVSDLDEAILHINKYNSKHSDAIVTNNKIKAAKFTKRVDAAAVYVNASTRFTDGAEFGLGAEIGISTQMLHARGPMGLKEITSYKYIINGTGQIR